MLTVYPTLIAPLFNKFTPLEVRTHTHMRVPVVEARAERKQLILAWWCGRMAS